MTPPNFVVIRRREGLPVEVWEFDDRLSAEDHYVRVSCPGACVLLATVNWWRDIGE